MSDLSLERLRQLARDGFEVSTEARAAS
jgi:hypothetical protein